MPRQKPLFNNFKNLFEGMDIKVDENTFNTNSKITIYCKNCEKSYITSITKIKSLNHDYKICPHCKNQVKHCEKRIALKDIEEIIVNSSFSIHNKKEFYKKWGDKIELICKHDNNIEEIKSINWWINNGKKIPKCYECLKVNVLCDEQYKKELARITDTVSFDIIPPLAVFKKHLTDNAKKIIEKYDWYINEYNGTKNKSTFICSICGTQKEAHVFSLRGCLNCKNNNLKQGVKNKLKDICEKNNLFILQQDVYKDVSTSIKFKCNNCNHEFENSWADITGKYYNLHCPNCYNSVKRKSQKEVYEFIKCNYTGTIEENSKSVIPPKEIDIYIPEKNIAIEYCGNIWHSEKFNKDKNYHYNKYKECLNKNIHLITLFEDEWKLTPDICKSRILNLMNATTNSIFARKCTIKELSLNDAKIFLDKSHFQGYCYADIHIALIYDTKIVSVMSFKNMENTQKQHQWELVRFANMLNTTVTGGASRLLNTFKLSHKGTVLSTFSDSRWCNGSFYEKIGFTFDYDIDPGYYYVGSYTKWKLKHRFTFKKDRLMEIFKESDSGKTEHQIALENGLYRIYDCGHKKFTLIC